MAKRNGFQSGLNAGNATNGVQQARQKNQQSMARAGQAANYEFGNELGAQGSAGLTPSVGTGNARQRNQQAMQNASQAGQNQNRR